MKKAFTWLCFTIFIVMLLFQTDMMGAIIIIGLGVGCIGALFGKKF